MNSGNFVRLTALSGAATMALLAQPALAQNAPAGQQLASLDTTAPGPRHAEIPGMDDGWKLFDVAHDPGETNDLAQREPRRAATLAAAWDAYGKQVGVVMASTPATYP